ncbi:MAG TPA: hypothetical protein VIO60_04385 [Rectinemataceae bacterium]
MDHATPEGVFRIGARRYISSPLRERRAAAVFGPESAGGGNAFAKAIRELSSEDEEPADSLDRGPIVFKDGIFQIDLSENRTESELDPALKGLIDSILGG